MGTYPEPAMPAAPGRECPDCGAEVVGVEFEGVYDGILFFGCIGCRRVWLRFLGHDRRAEAGRRYAADWAAARQTGQAPEGQ